MLYVSQPAGLVRGQDQFSVCIELLPVGLKRKNGSRNGAPQGMGWGGKLSVRRTPGWFTLQFP